MSSDDQPNTVRTVYASARRTVVTDGSTVMEIAGSNGWLRSIGSGGPMSGELLATMEDGRWSRALSPDEERLQTAARQ